MKYGSVCSGIEAATQAWHPLGWTPSFFSEIDPFPRAVLAHHYPDVPLHGDFTTIESGDYDPIDLLVGGTPCQSFSIAGLRGGLGDDRGNLALEYLRLADRLRTKWLVWENVPGVLSSSGGRDFGSILGGMVELGYGVAYRVLDAQYVRTLPFPWAIPQRRRRVFVVGYLGDWRRAAAVLFDGESMSGNPPPRREAGKAVAPTISARPTGGGGLGTDFDLDWGLVANSGDVSYCLAASAQQSLDAETETLIASATGDVSHALRAEGFDASEDGTGRGTLTIAIQERAISENHNAGPDGAGVRDDGASYTLEARSVCQAVAFDTTQVTSKGNYSNPKPGDPCHPLAAGAHPPAIATTWAVRRLTPTECERLQGFPDGFTDVPWRGKDHAPDGRRYKALGNSFAVNVVQWIGRRIEMVEAFDV
jgi:DNA (cytosine-5)-methyltransferase 1